MKYIIKSKKTRAEESDSSKFVCTLCGNYSDERIITDKYASDIYFSHCDECGRAVCSNCYDFLEDTYKDDGSREQACKVCYEAIEKEKKEVRLEREKQKEKRRERNISESP